MFPLHTLRGVLARRIAQVEARQRLAAALAAQQHAAGAHLAGQRPRLVDLGAGADAGAAGGQGVDDGRRRAQHVDDDGEAAGQPAGRRLAGEQVDLNVPILGHTASAAMAASEGCILRQPFPVVTTQRPQSGDGVESR